MNNYYSTYYPASTSNVSNISWVTTNGNAFNFQVPLEHHKKFMDPVITLGYRENSDNSKHLWSHDDLDLDILVGGHKVRYSVYKGDKVSFCEFPFSEFERLVEDEVCRKIVACELEVNNE